MPRISILARLIPQREGKHPAELLHATGAVLLVRVDDHLSIAVGGEPVPQLNEPLP